jgi:hypothetical protein
MDKSAGATQTLNPVLFFNILDQIYVIERKLEGIKEPNNISRNIEKIKDFFEKIYGTPSKPDVGLFYHDPIGDDYNETRTDLEASIAGESADNLVVTEVIKPIIRLGDRKKLSRSLDDLDTSRCVRKGVVVVESKTTRKDIEKEQPEDKKEESGETTGTSDSDQEPKLADKEKPESQEREDESKQLTSAENDQLAHGQQQTGDTSGTGKKDSKSTDSAGQTTQQEGQGSQGETQGSGGTEQLASGKDMDGSDDSKMSQSQSEQKPGSSDAGQGKQPEEPNTQTASGGQ